MLASYLLLDGKYVIECLLVRQDSRRCPWVTESPRSDHPPVFREGEAALREAFPWPD